MLNRSPLKRTRLSPCFGAYAIGLCATALGLLCAGPTAQAQSLPAGASVSLVRNTELRADKLSAAPVLAQLRAGQSVRMGVLEGGWVQVALVEAGREAVGWVRANALQLSAAPSAAALANSGRTGAGNTAMVLGVRSLQPRINRHALIIGVSRYADATIPSLPGVMHDKQSATQMANAMQVPTTNITYLHNEQATGDAIRLALRNLGERVQDGDRVFIHYSGHGTRYKDDAAGGCVEALLAHDGGTKGTLTNREMAHLLTPITLKTDKLFVMYDSCHSGGLVAPANTIRTRGLLNSNDAGAIRPKFSNITEECGRPVNVKTRNLTVEQVDKGVLPQDIVHMSAARHNEMSFDDEEKGGLATQFMRDCMLREAKDLDRSGAISIDEIRQCAQEKIDKRMRNDASFKPHSLLLSGNLNFVPAWFSKPADLAGLAQAAPATVTVQVAGAAAVNVLPSLPPAATATSFAPALAPIPPAVLVKLSGEAALAQMHEQRDAKRKISVTANKTTLKIKQDVVDFSVSSDRAGYVYVALAGSDNESLYMIFPNALDSNNRIEANTPLQLPRNDWRIRANGPEGKNTLLVMVTDGPRDLEQLRKQAEMRAGPFVKALNDSDGRAQLGALLSTSASETDAVCRSPQRKLNPQCSDAYGSALITLTEVN